MDPLRQIAIVGGSLAGLRGAEALRQQGFEGRIVFVGAEPHLPYDRPPLSKEILRGTWEPERASLVRGDSFEKLELDLRLGRRAVSLDARERRLALDDGSRVAYDGLLIATGARPRSLPGAAPLAGVYTLRTVDDCLALRADLERSPRVAVVGAGFIGAEVAATCRQRGLEVAMVEALPLPLAQTVGAEVGETLASAHRDQGVDLRLGVGVAALEGSDRVEGLRLGDGSRLAADVVVVGIGVVPETGWLAGSGVELDDGVVCDETCATSLPGVVAAGDVAAWRNPLFGEAMRVEHWSNATEQARAAAATLLASAAGEKAAPYESVPFFWSDQYDLKIQSAGRLAGADESRLVHGSLAERRFLVLYGRSGRLAGALAVNEPRRLIQYRRRLRERPSFAEAVAAESKPPQGGAQ
jgi:3-phenylpropionate/trans-cinnamate dioxygenase ferredoxin reductase subunit